MGAWCCIQSGVCGITATLVQLILKTSLGDIDIELWPKEAPKVRFTVSSALPASSKHFWNPTHCCSKLKSVVTVGWPRLLAVPPGCLQSKNMHCPMEYDWRVAGRAQFRAAVPGGLLRWVQFPPRYQRLPGPGRRPDRHGHWWRVHLRAPLRRRVPLAPSLLPQACSNNSARSECLALQLFARQVCVLFLHRPYSAGLCKLAWASVWCP